MALRGLLFDKDGTLIHFDETWHPAILSVLQTQTKGDSIMLARLADALDYDLQAKAFRKGASFVAGSWADYGQVWADALCVTNNGAFEAETNTLLNAAVMKTLSPVGNPLKTLQRLANSGLRLGVATNDSEFAALEQSHALGLTDLLHYVAGCDSGHGAKPNPGMIHAFARAVNIPEREIALVGDSIHDMETARNAGAIAIAVLTGPATRMALAPHADHVLDSIEDMPALVQRLNANPA